LEESLKGVLLEPEEEREIMLAATEKGKLIRAAGRTLKELKKDIIRLRALEGKSKVDLNGSDKRLLHKYNISFLESIPLLIEILSQQIEEATGRPARGAAATSQEPVFFQRVIQEVRIAHQEICAGEVKGYIPSRGEVALLAAGRLSASRISLTPEEVETIMHDHSHIIQLQFALPYSSNRARLFNELNGLQQRIESLYGIMKQLDRREDRNRLERIRLDIRRARIEKAVIGAILGLPSMDAYLDRVSKEDIDYMVETITRRGISLEEFLNLVREASLLDLEGSRLFNMLNERLRLLTTTAIITPRKFQPDRTYKDSEVYIRRAKTLQNGEKVLEWASKVPRDNVAVVLASNRDEYNSIVAMEAGGKKVEDFVEIRLVAAKDEPIEGVDEGMIIRFESENITNLFGELDTYMNGTSLDMLINRLNDATIDTLRNA